MKSSATKPALVEASANRKAFSGSKGKEPFFSKVQPKLTVGQPGDKYEVEADAMADKVVQRLQKPDNDKPTPFFQSFQGNAALQTKCDSCEEDVQTKENSAEGKISDTIQTKAFTDDSSNATVDTPQSMESKASPVLSFVSNSSSTLAKSELGHEEEVQAKEEESSDEELMLQRACRECEEGDAEVMFKLMPSTLQRSPQANVRDEASIRKRIVEIAHAELGGIEAKKKDSTGRRLGYRRLLDYFHLAAPNVWPDAVVEYKREGFPSWCGIFSVFVIKTAGIDVGNWQMGRGVSAFNSLEVTSTPQPGDIGYIDQPYQHHCIVTEVNGDTIKSIDGNSGWYSEVVEMTRPRTKFSGFFTAFTGREKYIQKKEEELQTKPSPDIQMMDGNSSDIESQLSSSKGSGSSLPEPTRNQMESSFGADFSNVKVHTDSNAVAMSQSLNAQAFTHGNDVYFNEGKYDTTSSGGQHLLAHELTHTIQQGAAVQKKEQISQTTTRVQRLFDFDLSYFNDYARYIPGWTLFTVLMGYNPLLGQQVDRNAVNVLDGLMGLAPLGTLLFNKLQEHNIITDAYNWTLDLLSELELTSDGITNLFEEAWDDMDFVRTDPFDYNLGVLTGKFRTLYNRVREFAIRVADKVFTMIKEVLMTTIRSLAAAIPGYTLLTMIIHFDPLTDTEVEASTADIIEEFLLMVGAEQELEKMKETGSLEETATWIDEQLTILDFSLEDITNAFVTAWEAFSVNDLLEPTAALERTVGIFAPFATKVFTFASNVVSKVFELIKKYLLGLLKEAANVVPGYHLLTVILERDPFTEEHVPRTTENLIRGFMGLIPGGEAQFQQMKESGAIAQLTDWLDAEVEALGLTWEYIKNMFLEIWDMFTIENLMDPAPAFQQVIARFGEPLGRLIRFVVRLVMKVIEIILRMMNFPLDLIQNIIANAQSAFADIKRDPIGFLKNILRAIKEGFSLFFSNIATHLLNGVTDWLFGQLGDAGITPPADFSFQSILGLVLEILGVTTDRIMEKVAARIGPERMERLQNMADTAMGVWSFVSDVMERGPIAIWEKIQEKLTTLWDTVLDSIKSWIMTTIITQVTTKLLGMLDPTGIMAVINGCIAFYNAVQSFIEYLREMLEIVNSFVAGVAEIARGSVNSAAQFLEGALSQAMPIAIGFLANQVGLGSIGRRIGEMITNVREMIDGALDWLVDKAVTMGESVLGAFGIGGNGQDAGENGSGELDDSEVGKSVRFNVEGESHRIWIQVNGNDVEVMLASTPTPIPQKINFFKNRKDSLPDEKKEQATGLISQAEANYLTTKEKAQQAKTEISEAQANPTNEEIQQAQQKDQETENAEETLKRNIVDLFRLYGDENGVTERFSEQLGRLHSSAHDVIMDELLNNNSSYSNIESWSALLVQLKSTSNVTRMVASPMHIGHNFGAYVHAHQAMPALQGAMSALGKTDENLGGQTREEFVTRRRPVVNGSRNDEARMAKSELIEEIFENSKENSATSALQNYYNKSLTGTILTDAFKPQNIRFEFHEGVLMMRYDYGEEAENEGGKQDFTVSIILSNVDKREVRNVTRGTNLAFRVPGTRGYTHSQGVVSGGVDYGINLNSAHVLADQFMGSGYKNSLNLILTSAEFNQQTMATAENSIRSQIENYMRANPDDIVTFTMTVSALWEALPDDEVIETLEGVKPDLTEEEKQETIKKLSGVQNPRRCKQVRYMARITINGSPTSVAFNSATEHGDSWLDNIFSN